MTRARLASLAVLCFLAFLVVAVFVPQLNLALLRDSDSFLHVRIGLDILKTGAFPSVDTYSWTRAGAPYVAYEWLFGVLSAFFYRLRETDGLILLGGALWAATAGLLAAHARARRASWLATLAVVALFGWMSRYSALTRPHLVAWVGFAGGLFALDCARWRRPGGPQALAVFAAAVLWANLHPSVLLFAGVLAFECAGAALEALRRKGSWREAGWQGLLFALFCAGTLVNPYGWGLHRTVLSFLSEPVFREVIVEHWPAWRVPGVFSAFLVCAGALAVLAPLNRGRFRLAQWLQLTALAVLAWFSSRSGVLFVIAAAPILASGLSVALERLRLGWDWPEKSCAARDAAWLAAGTAVVVARLAIFGAPYSQGAIEYHTGLPSGSVRYAHSHLGELGPRLFNDYRMSGYLIHALPERPVFIDKRAEFHGAAALEAFERIRLDRDGRALDELARLRIDWVLIGKSAPVYSALRAAPERWRQVFSEEPAAVFVPVSREAGRNSAPRTAREDRRDSR